jgi:hypothetical protein
MGAHNPHHKDPASKLMYQLCLSRSITLADSFGKVSELPWGNGYWQEDPSWWGLYVALLDFSGKY